jgi:type I restriction enzyme M protein
MNILLHGIPHADIRQEDTLRHPQHKADLMFVQHMIAVLKANGKMATVMPHGVLFRGGEEKEARKHFGKHG